MKLSTKTILTTTTLISTTAWLSLVPVYRTHAASSPTATATEMMSSYEAEQKAAAAARAKDAAWKPSTKEIGLIKVDDGKNPGSLRNFCLDKSGNVLACYAKTDEGVLSKNGKDGPGLRLYSPKGELLKTIPLPIKPTAVCITENGEIYTAGDGRLLKISETGQILASTESPVSKLPVKLTSEVEDMVKENAKENKRPVKEELARMKTMLEKRRSDVTGLAVSTRDVFMAVPAPNDFTYRIYRFSHDLTAPTLVVEKLRGCCGQMDVQTHANNLWIPHNARHSVESRDRDGKELAKFGNAGRVKASDFGGCCEPKNLRVLANGDILAAESGPPTCIKRFSADGKFKGVVALADGSKGDCVRVTVEMSPDGSRYYLLDTTRDAIRIFAAAKP